MQTIKTNAIAGAVAALFVAALGVNAQAQNMPQSGAVFPGGQNPQQQMQPQAGGVPAQQTAQAAQPGQQIQQTGPNGMPVLPKLPGEQSGIRAGAIAIDDLMPPNLAKDVLELKERRDAYDRAMAASAGVVAKPVTRSITITQAAGEVPDVVRVAPGIPTNVVFLDSTGQPWPIEYATPGDSSKFEVVMPMAGTSSLQIRPRFSYGYSGLSVTLKNNPIPISLTLTVGQAQVDARLDVKVARRGPNAAAPIIDRTGSPHATDVTLMSFLDGVPPQGSREVKTSLSSVRAWMWNDRLVVRTDQPLVSPAWSDSTSSPSGVTNAYILPVVPSILVATDGRMMTVKIDN